MLVLSTRRRLMFIGVVLLICFVIFRATRGGDPTMRNFLALELMAFAGLLIVIGAWSGTRSLNLMFNSSMISLFTPSEVFPFQNRQEMNKRIADGMKRMPNMRLVVCGMVRDVEESIPHMIRKVTKTVAHFADARILIVENDSTDRTRPLLLEWAKRDPRVFILGCGVNAPACSMKFPPTIGHAIDRRRIEKMCFLRNIYLRALRGEGEFASDPRFADLRNFDLTAMWDLDILGSVYLDGLAAAVSEMATDPRKGVLCSHGIFHLGLGLTNYFDIYATLLKGEHYRKDLEALHFIKTAPAIARKVGDDSFEVESCFGGFTLYRTDVLLPSNIVYDMSPESWNLECEHTRLHAKISANWKKSSESADTGSTGGTGGHPGTGVWSCPRLTHGVVAND